VRFALPFFLLVAGCAAIGPDWPSLALRPSEQGGAASAEPTASAAPEVAPDPAMASTAGQAVAKDLNAAEAMWRAQADALAKALPAGRPPAEGSERWAEAQVELSRLEVIGSELEEIARRAEALPANPGRLAMRANAALDRHRATALAARTIVDR